MNETIQFIISSILTIIFYRYYSKKISDNFPLLFSFLLVIIFKIMKINFNQNNFSLIPYYIFFIICLKNMILCLKGKITLLKIFPIILTFIAMTYIILY